MADEAQGDLLTKEASQTETTSKQWFSEENREVVERCGWKEPDDVIKGYRGLEKDYSGKVKMPTPESSAEEIRAFYQKTGCPENPDGYEVKVPEGLMPELRNEDMEKFIKQVLYDGGAPKQLGEKLFEQYYDKIQLDRIKYAEASELKLREQHGDNYDEVIKTADRFFDTCSEEFCTVIKATGLGANPVFINEWFAKGKQMLSDTLVKGEAEGDKTEDGYVPGSTASPEMYEDDESENGVKARAYFRARGFTYSRKD